MKTTFFFLTYLWCLPQVLSITCWIWQYYPNSVCSELNSLSFFPSQTPALVLLLEYEFTLPSIRFSIVILEGWESPSSAPPPPQIHEPLWIPTPPYPHTLPLLVFSSLAAVLTQASLSCTYIPFIIGLFPKAQFHPLFILSSTLTSDRSF